MKLAENRLRLAATDLSNHLACPHTTTLDRARLAGLVKVPPSNPDRLDRLRERGLEHEQAYLDHLASLGRSIASVPTGHDVSHDLKVARTLELMRSGVDVIAQAAFADDRWIGYADVLLRVDTPSDLGPWSYEVVDTKLTQHTKAGTILQLCLYADLLTPLQGRAPERIHVVTPGRGFEPESYRLAEVDAYYRAVKHRLEQVADLPPDLDRTYPLPTTHCDVCRWWALCTKRRRDDDHPTLVAGLSVNQLPQLAAWQVSTMTDVAGLPDPLPSRPDRGTPSTYSNLRHQAALQVASRGLPVPRHDLRESEPGKGLARLPEPSPGDVFLDFEAARFVDEGGLEYLLGWVILDDRGTLHYRSCWALTRADEKVLLETFIDELFAVRKRHPDFHAFHFGAYDLGAIKRLATRHSTREEELDELLREKRFVDLHSVLRQGVRVGVESYSLKALEPCYGLTRKTDLREASAALRAVEAALERNLPDTIEPATLDTVESYNREDCISAFHARNWLEARRADLLAGGVDLARPEVGDGAPPEKLDERTARARAIAAQLLAAAEANSARIPDPGSRVPPLVLLAANLEWFRREQKTAWWEHFRLADLDDEERLHDAMAISGLELVGRFGGTDACPVHRYRAPAQEVDLRGEPQAKVDANTAIGTVAALHRDASALPSEPTGSATAPGAGPVATPPLPSEHTGSGSAPGACGSAHHLPPLHPTASRTAPGAGAADTQLLPSERTGSGSAPGADGIGTSSPHILVDIKKSAAHATTHPTSIFLHTFIDTPQQSDALLRLGQWVADHGIDADLPTHRAARDLLLGLPPRGIPPADLTLRPGEDELAVARRVAPQLDHGVLAIQGPPGTGKTYTGARLIVELVRHGRRVGITATSHKVIRNLLDEVVKAGTEAGRPVRCLQKISSDDGAFASTHAITVTTSNADAITALEDGTADVVAGTAWLWAREDLAAAAAVDVLVIDEAGQFSLANALAVSQAARSLVLLGDQQQLEQPSKAAHPDGSDRSALEHLLDGHETIPADRGIFLAHTWRMHPAITAFTSEQFYEGRLESRPDLATQALHAGAPPALPLTLGPAGLFLLPVEHQGNQNHAPEEVEAIAALLEHWLETGATWTNKQGESAPLTLDDIVIVAPYNVQVGRLLDRLPPGARVGTVDKFQGQEAPVVIYSMTTSSPADAPRGMEFLYSRNRLNVATSRARCACVVVCSPTLLAPDCRTPQQIRLANALARYAELATVQAQTSPSRTPPKARNPMAKLEDLLPDATIRGIVPNALVTVAKVEWHGSDALTLIYRRPNGGVGEEILYRHDEARLEVADVGRPWSFDGDGKLFRLAAEAHRIRLAHLFDPVLAVHTSLVDPLPHQITAVYEAMLPKQPLRFLLADDPGAGKTIMAGLLIRELIARGDLRRCLIVCPGSLVEQWQDELFRRFQLPFEILTNDKLEAARTGNWFLENDLAIARLDKLSRSEEVQEKLSASDCYYDLIVCDEAHKLSATFFGGEVKYTKRYRLGQLLSGITRNFLLMTATPHNGKEEDFQLFLALLDGDRFEGRFRDGAHQVDTSDLMRRMVKENLLKFDGRPLFPERIAYTVPYKLSDEEAALYKSVTDYVREEFNRAEALQNDKRSGTVGFALTVLQRRLASSPEAIFQSLKRRRERLEKRLRELLLLQRGAAVEAVSVTRLLDPEDLEDLDDAPEDELETLEAEVLDEATAAATVNELRLEIGTLQRLEGLAAQVRRSGHDTKWRELASLLTEVFTPAAIGGDVAEAAVPYGAGPIPKPVPSATQKIVIFTEHRDTLNYLENRIAALLGRAGAIVAIHGAIGRDERRKAQELFLHDPKVQVLLATDAAGEGINLQRAHLMVNYDLPWNPNRLEQRFGRIHRIGQTEVCHLWNLIASETREGDVYQKLLNKLEEARSALGGQVFDVLGQLQFEGKPLRDLLIEAIRYGDRPEVRARLNQAIENGVDRSRIQDLIEDHALAHDAMDSSLVARVRDDMERAEARRLQPHFIEAFFRGAFDLLGGTVRSREPQRFEITHVPAPVRNRDRLIGNGKPVLPRYERVVFEKDQVAPPGLPLADFVCPGHPLLDAVLDLTLERHGDLLKRGTILVDERDPGTQPRVLFFLEHAIQDGQLLPSGERRSISRRFLYVEITADRQARHLHYAPYLDYRPLGADEPDVAQILGRPECSWITKDIENLARQHAIAKVVPEHVEEVRGRRLSSVEKIRAAVKDRLVKEISFWDKRAEMLKLQEQAGKPGARLNSQEARRRADELQTRLHRRYEELDREAQVSALPPVVIGGSVIVPIGLLNAITGRGTPRMVELADTQAIAARARAIVMDIERRLGNEPRDVEFEKVGYDVESRTPGDQGRLRFIEVKGRAAGARDVFVTKNEIITALNQPDQFILAIVELIDATQHRVRYVRRPFLREPDFHSTGSTYDLAKLLAMSEEPN